MEIQSAIPGCHSRGENTTVIPAQAGIQRLTGPAEPDTSLLSLPVPLQLHPHAMIHRDRARRAFSGAFQAHIQPVGQADPAA